MTTSFPASQIQRNPMVLPLGDLLSISAICAVRQPQRVFEIGTYTGSTTLLMAMNTAASAELFTLDLRVDDMPESWLDANSKPPFEAGILFRDTPFQSKIRQLFGRSDAFDFSKYKGSIDLVYIDADHSYDAVFSDSKIAFELVSPGGMIVWDDYRWLPEHSAMLASQTLCISFPRRTIFVNCRIPGWLCHCQGLFMILHNHLTEPVKKSCLASPLSRISDLGNGTGLSSPCSISSHEILPPGLSFQRHYWRGFRRGR